MSKINKIRLSGTDYDIQDVSATSVVELTQQQYDELPATAKTSNILYIITDAQAGDLTNYYTKTETNTLLGGKQDTLVSGTNIKTINNISLLGSGNIDIQGGGKAIEAGRGISITTGATADTVSFNLPISAGTGTNSVAEGSGTTASGNQSHAEGSGTTASSYQCHAEGYDTKASGRCSHAEGSGTKASGDFSHAEGFSTTASGSQSHAEGLITQANGNHSHAEGNWTTASGDYSHAEGRYTVTKNEAEHASGQYNVSNSATTEFGDSGNTLFSVGNGTADNARHNAFEIRQNGDIYLSSGGTDIKLQDHLGGGGGGTVESAITSGSTNAVESKAIWSATTFNKSVLLTFNGVYSTNYPNGCTKLIVEVVGNDVSTMTFYNDDQNLGKITITNFGSIAVYNSFNGASYEISGTTVLITYPTVTSVTKISMDNGKYVYTAVVEGAWVNENTYMKPEVDSIATSLQKNINSKQDTLVSGTNIKTINNESILGSGNIDIQGGGGKAIEAGRGIAITTGETADTVSFDLPISATTSENLIIGDTSNQVNDSYNSGKSIVFGRYSKVKSYDSLVGGYNCSNEKGQSQAFGNYTKTKNQNEFGCGKYNNSVSSSSTFGDSGNTLFSVGNGTADNARHNAFEIRQNGDIYLTKDGQDVKLQDQLGGGGSSYTAGDGIDITNNVISVTGKVDTTTYETYTAATDTAIAGKQDILTGGNGIDINNDVISVTGKADTSAVTAIQDSLSGYVTTDTEQEITGEKTFVGEKKLKFKQRGNSSKIGFTLYNSASTNNELASFELRPNTFAVDGVQHPLLYFGHYRNTNTAAAGVQQTYIGFRQYDQPHDAAYHYLIPLPEKAKTPFSLTTSFKDYYAPMGFKNGSTMITADDTGVVDLSSEFSGKADTATTYTKTEVDTALSGKVDTSAITTSVTSSSTDAQVPSAKAVYDIVGDIETLLSQI